MVWSRRVTSSNCGTTFPRGAFNAFSNLSLLSYRGQSAGHRKHIGCCAVNRSQVREDTSSETGTRNPTKD